MDSSELLDTLNAWKSAEEEVVVHWSSTGSDKTDAVSFRIEGHIAISNNDSLEIEGDASERTTGVPASHASFSFKDAKSVLVEDRSVRVTFSSGAILGLTLVRAVLV